MRVPVLAHNKGVLLGRGFRWRAHHTQQLETALAQTGYLPVADDDRGGYPALHAVGLAHEQPVIVRWSELVGHMGMLGATRSGKTRGIELLVTEAIQGDGAVVILDPKGDADLLARCAVEAHRARRPFALVCPAFPQQSATLNPLSACVTPAEVATRVQALMPGGGDTRDPFFVEYPLTLAEHVAAAQQALGERWTVEGLRQPLVVRDQQEALLARYLQRRYGLGDGTASRLPAVLRQYRARVQRDTVADDLMTDLSWPTEHFRKVTANLLPAFRGVTGEPFGSLFSTLPADVTWGRIDQDAMVVYVALASLLLGETANRMGRLLLQDLVGYIGQRYAYSYGQKVAPLTIVVDEFSDVVYPLFLDALSKGGGAGARFILAMQSMADPEATLGQARTRQVFDNLNTQVWFRLADVRTATEISRGFGTCSVALPEEGAALTYGGPGGLSARADRRLKSQSVPLWRPSWLLGLPRGEAIARIQGDLWKIRVPLLTPPDSALVARLGLAPVTAALREAAQQTAVKAAVCSSV
jgi:conjugal transfer pilus assembly protein TraD